MRRQPRRNTHVRPDCHPYLCPSASRQDQRGRLPPALPASLDDPDGFWAEHGRRLDWIKPFTKVRNASFEGDVRIAWYEDGTLNASYNCIDRHLPKRADQTAILWEGDDPGEDRRVTYRELHEAVCRLANVLRARGVEKGDRVTIYLPMIPEAVVAMLACARIGADPFGRVRRLFARQPRRPHPGLPLDGADHRRRGAARRPHGPAEAQRRQCPAALPRGARRDRRASYRRCHRLGRRPRPLVSRGLRRRLARLPARGNVGRRPAFHSLHFGLDRAAQRRAAHDRRLSRLHLADP